MSIYSGCRVDTLGEVGLADVDRGGNEAEMLRLLTSYRRGCVTNLGVQMLPILRISILLLRTTCYSIFFQMILEVIYFSYFI